MRCGVVRVGRPLFRLCRRHSFLFLLYTKEVVERGEVFLNDEAYSLRRQAVARKVAVVSLVIYPYREIAIREEQIPDVEVSDE